MGETHGITPEEIAREAAAAVVTVKTRDDGRHHLASSLMLPDGFGLSWQSRELAEKAAENNRAPLAALVLAAVERALREVPVPGGLSAERVAKIARESAEDERLAGPPKERDSWQMHVKELLADNAHLRRALHDCGQDGTSLIWSAGYEAGREAGRKEGFAEGARTQHRDDVQYANEEAATFIEGEAGHAAAAADVAYAVHEAPLAAPPPDEGSER